MKYIIMKIASVTLTRLGKKVLKSSDRMKQEKDNKNESNIS